MATKKTVDLPAELVEAVAKQVVALLGATQVEAKAKAPVHREVKVDPNEGKEAAKYGAATISKAGKDRNGNHIWIPRAGIQREDLRYVGQELLDIADLLDTQDEDEA